MQSPDLGGQVAYSGNYYEVTKTSMNNGESSSIWVPRSKKKPNQFKHFGSYSTLKRAEDYEQE